jgi:hypothetical protein
MLLEGIETLPAVWTTLTQFATHMAVFFYSFHKLEIEVVLAGILRLRTNYNADDIEHDILARPGNHCCHGNATMPSICIGMLLSTIKEILRKSNHSRNDTCWQREGYDKADTCFLGE